MKGMQIWVMTLLKYDQYGKATVLKSFAKIAKESMIQKEVKGNVDTKKSVTSGVKKAW